MNGAQTAARSALPFRSPGREPRTTGDPGREWESGRSRVIVVDDDSMVADGIAAMLEKDGRTILICNDAETAMVALREFPFTHLISDLQLSTVPFEGVHLVDAARRAQPNSRIVVISGYGSHIVKSAALAVGADAFLSKPFDLEDMEKALGGPHRGPVVSGDSVLLRVQTVEALLASGVIEAHFQPIFSLQEAGPQAFGFEALARAGEDWPFPDMRTLFESAARIRKVRPLNAACVAAAFRDAAQLPGSTHLFVNVDPSALGSTGFDEVIRRSAAVASVDLSKVVLELTETAVPYEMHALLRAVNSLRADGVQFAFGDAESAVANIAVIDQIRPSFMKINHHAGTSFHTDARKVDLVTRIVGLSDLVGAKVALEGIDSQATLDAARQAGIQLGQGFWMGERASAGPHRSST